MRNQFYCEREQLRGKIEMINRYLIHNHDFLLQSEIGYHKRLDSCKNQYEHFLVEDNSISNFADFEQIYLNGCLMYLISQYEFYIKKVYEAVCVKTKNEIESKNKNIVKSYIKEIKNLSNIKFYKSTLKTFDTITCIIEIRNKLVHVSGQSYFYEEVTKQHIKRHQYKIKSIPQIDGRLDIYLTPKYIIYVCNIIQHAFFSITKSVHKKLKPCKL